MILLKVIFLYLICCSIAINWNACRWFFKKWKSRRTCNEKEQGVNDLLALEVPLCSALCPRGQAPGRAGLQASLPAPSTPRRTASCPLPSAFLLSASP